MKAMRSQPSRWAAACLALTFTSLVPISSVGGAPSYVATELAKHIEASIVGLDFDEARRELDVAQTVVDDPRIGLERARLALYELDCDKAAAILARPEIARLQDGEMLADTARGCQRVTSSLILSEDKARGIEVRWQDENDASLAPLLFDTVALAREALSRDLAVDWGLPTRIVVVRDLLSLSAMTGLPYESARTTGTVAVAKWGRVTLLSPRATRHGFPWRDTVAHELTHLAVTRATGDRAPLWLQEGVAKREEVRWRRPGPFDDRPPADAIAQQGVERGLAIRLDKLGPSIAMLPTADAARVAFAEVTSFVGFYLEQQGAGALPRLFQELKNGKDPDAALIVSSAADFKTWDARWRAFVASRPRVPLPPLLSLGAEDPTRRHSDLAAMRELRDRARLAELLLARDHPAEALDELGHIDAGIERGTGDASNTMGGNGGAGPITAKNQPDVREAVTDPSIVWLHGRALEMLGRSSELMPLVSEADRVASSYGPWWALRGRWAAALGDAAAASDSFSEGLAADPLDLEVACGTVDASALPVSLSTALDQSLCDAARARGEPPFDGD